MRFINHLLLITRLLIGQTSVLAFYFSDHPVDAASKWAALSQGQQRECVDNYHKNNIKIMVSAGGGSVHPTTQKWDPVVTAKNVVKFVKDNHLDGVDLDWEVCLFHRASTQTLF